MRVPKGPILSLFAVLMMLMVTVVPFTAAADAPVPEPVSDPVALGVTKASSLLDPSSFLRLPDLSQSVLELNGITGIGTDIPSIDDIIVWLNEEKESETVAIDDEVKVTSGQSYEIGKDNTYNVGDDAFFTFEQGSKLVIGPNFQMNGDMVRIHLMEGSILSICGKDYPISEYTVITIDGSLGMRFEIGSEQADIPGGKKLKVEINGWLDLDGQFSIGDVFLMNGFTKDEVVITIRTDLTVLPEGLSMGDSAIWANLDVDMPFIYVSVKDIDFTFTNTVLTLETVYDPTKEVPEDMYASLQTDLEVSEMDQQGNVSKLKYPLTATVHLTAPMDPEPSPAVPLFGMEFTIIGDMSAEAVDYEMASDDLSVSASIQCIENEGKREIVLEGDIKANRITSKSEDSDGGTDIYMESIGANVKVAVPAEEFLHRGETGMTINRAYIEFRTERIHGDFRDIVDGQPYADIYMDVRRTAVILDDFTSTEEPVLEATSTKFYLRADYHQTDMESRRIDIVNLKVSPNGLKYDGILKISGTKIDYKEQPLLSNANSVTAKVATATVRIGFKTNITLETGSYIVNGLSLPYDVMIKKGATVRFNDFVYAGHMEIEDSNSVSGVLKLPFADDTMVRIDGNPITFKETIMVTLELDLANKMAYLRPAEGVKLDPYPDTGGYVSYTIREDGIGIASSLYGIFYAETSNQIYEVRFGDDVRHCRAYEFIEVPSPEAREGQTFVGWFDGDQVYDANYLVPPRNVDFKAIWAHNVTDADIDTARGLCTIKVAGDAMYIDPTIMKSLQYMAEQKSTQEFTLIMGDNIMLMDAECILGFEESLLIHVEESDARTMPEYARPIGNGHVYHIDMIDADGHVHEIKGSLTVYVYFRGEYRDDLSEINAYYMEPDGRMDRVQSESLEVRDEVMVTMHLTHLSDYVIKDDHQPNEIINVPICISLAVFTIIATAVGLFIITRE